MAKRIVELHLLVDIELIGHGEDIARKLGDTIDAHGGKIFACLVTASVDDGEGVN